jgi:hypothetical protein
MLNILSLLIAVSQRCTSYLNPLIIELRMVCISQPMLSSCVKDGLHKSADAELMR